MAEVDRCSICLDEIKESLKCINKDCMNLMCKSCAEDYIVFCSKELNLLPKCYSCNTEYIYSNLFKIIKNVDIYYETLYKYLKGNPEIQKMENEKLLRDKFFNEKKEFIEKKAK